MSAALSARIFFRRAVRFRSHGSERFAPNCPLPLTVDPVVACARRSLGPRRVSGLTSLECTKYERLLDPFTRAKTRAVTAQVGYRGCSTLSPVQA